MQTFITGEKTAVLVVKKGGSFLIAESRNGNVTYREADEDTVTVAEKVSALCMHFPLLDSVEREIDSCSIRDLVYSIREALERHVTFRRVEEYSLVATWCASTFFFPVFRCFPVLYIGKLGFGVGGTTTLYLTLALSVRPRVVVDPTDASLRLFIELARPTVGIDEVRRDMLAQVRKAIARLIDEGFHRGLMSMKCKGGGTDLVVLDLYCPKIVVDPDGTIERASNLSRSVRIWLRRDPNRKEIADPYHYVEKYEHIAQMGYACFLKHAHTVHETYSKVMESADTLDLSGRGVQAYAPLLAVAKLAGEEVYRDVYNLCKQLDREAMSTPDKTVQLLLAVIDVLREAVETNSLSKLVRAGNIGIYLDLNELARRVREKVKDSGLGKIYPVDVEAVIRRALGNVDVRLVGYIRALVLAQSGNEKELLQDLITKLESSL